MFDSSFDRGTTGSHGVTGGYSGFCESRLLAR
jgi:hypothetical protein